MGPYGAVRMGSRPLWSAVPPLPARGACVGRPRSTYYSRPTSVSSVASGGQAKRMGV